MISFREGQDGLRICSVTIFLKLKCAETKSTDLSLFQTCRNKVMPHAGAFKVLKVFVAAINCLPACNQICLEVYLRTTVHPPPS